MSLDIKSYHKLEGVIGREQSRRRLRALCSQSLLSLAGVAETEFFIFIVAAKRGRER